jgi:tetratricopeptide (TPR) repeat protein
MPLKIASQKQGVLWNGSFFVHHSLALVNRELTLALLEERAFSDRFDLGIAHYEAPTFTPDVDPRFAALASREHVTPQDVRVTVRHRWPPEFTRPDSGKLVLIQPWEFGSLPRPWVQNIALSVDEMWVPSTFVRESYLRSGVPGSKVVVVPNGVNLQRFHPNVTPYDFAANPKTQHLRPDTYKFLFVGGTIARKGVDALLDAYDHSFTAQDNVTLIIKDFGANSFYANQGAAKLIQALQEKPGAPDLVYLTDDLSEAEIAALYAASDCLVHPYRGEGYGLPIAEAMACGKPTIVTGYGAALDFANERNSYLIPAELQRLPEKQISGMETVDYPFWAEPNRNALGALLQRVVSEREEAAARGAQAAADIAARHTWADAARIAVARLVALADEAAANTVHISLPQGLGVLGQTGLSRGFSGLSIAGQSPGLRALGEMYEDRKQAALEETRAGDWQNAAEELEACLIERPDDWDTINALAVVRFRQGQNERAEDLLRRGIASAPNPRDFCHNLAFLLLARDNPEEALEYALQALEYTPEQADIRRTVERASEAILKKARQLLRRTPEKQRAKAKRSPEYRALMEAYQRAETVLTAPQSTDSAQNQEPESAPRPRLSLCMIVKNEERFLRNCLESARGLVDEIIMVDTGSTDGTLEIAREYDAKIVPHPWHDDFSEARNVSLEHAAGEWVLWLDADEEIAPGTQEAFRNAMDTAPANVGAYLVEFHNWLQSTTRKEGSEMAIHHACRLFRRVPGVRFEGRIHEQNLRSLQSLGYKQTRVEGLIIDHFGYAGEIMTLRNKHERFIRMLIREVEECPDEAYRNFHLFNLGNAYFTQGDMENAAHYLGLAAEEPDTAEEYTVTLFTELATSLHRLGRAQEGVQVCEQADALGLEHSGIEFARGYCLLHRERYEEAEMAFRTALTYGSKLDSAYGRTGDAGISGYKALYGLSLALVGQDRHEEALPYCEQALEQQTTFVEARYLLGIILMQLEQTSAACREFETILTQDPNHEDAASNLGTLHFNNEDYAAALPHLRWLAQRTLNNYDTLARLATCCDQLGLMEEARDTYERLRQLAPDSAEICVNLGRVLGASGANAEAIDCFSEAIQINPRYANAYFNAGDLLYRLGVHHRAADIYIEGLKVEPEFAPGFFMLGNCYFHTRDYAAAVVAYRQALTLNPAYEEARNNLELTEAMAAQEQDSVQAA